MTIVVGIEDKIYGEAIIDFIGKQKWSPDSKFILVHALDLVSSGAAIGELCCARAGELIEAQKTEARQLLMEMDLKLIKALPGVSTEQRLICGYPREVLLDQVEQEKADTLILGSHGRRGIARFLLGSVSLSLLSQAPCTVLIVKRAQPETATNEQHEAAATTSPATV